MFEIPIWFVLFFLFLLGSIMGSFLDVFTTRFHTGRSINGRSRCMSCGHTLSWYELFPLLSYLVLRGRCRACHARIPMRLFWMEIITGTLFAILWLAVSSVTELAVGLAFTMLAIVITLYDVRHMVIPNTFVAAAWLLAGSALLIELWPMTSIMVLIPYAISGASASLFFASLWFFSRGRWIGFGDAKLAFALGIMLTPTEAFSFVVLSFWVGAAISLGLLALQWLSKRGQNYLRFFDLELTIKSEVPFAPFLLIAFALVYFFNLNVFSFFAVTL